MQMIIGIAIITIAVIMLLLLLKSPSHGASPENQTAPGENEIQRLNYARSKLAENEKVIEELPASPELSQLIIEQDDKINKYNKLAEKYGAEKFYSSKRLGGN